MSLDTNTDSADFEARLHEASPILDGLRKRIIESGERCEGNSFMYGGATLEYTPEFKNKQKNLYACGKHATRILEIGFNAGHSSLLFLLANDTSKLTVFDINIHKYTRPCLEYLQSLFPGRIEFFAGDSMKTVPEYHTAHPDARFDLIHVDGSHEREYVLGDMENVRKMSTLDTIVVLDDDNDATIREINQMYEDKGRIRRVEGVLPTQLCTHLIVQWTSLGEWEK